MYGEKNTFYDAATTVTEFLDDFYDEGGGESAQAFQTLEARLRAYFGYEPRGPSNEEEREGGHV